MSLAHLKEDVEVEEREIGVVKLGSQDGVAGLSRGERKSTAVHVEVHCSEVGG